MRIISRWHSTCDMIEQLIKLKNFIEENKTAHPELDISEEEWNDVVDVYEVLRPAKIATKILQVRCYISHQT